MATAVVVRAEPRVYRPMLAFWLVAALCFAGVRTLKYIEVWQTWELRDPKLMQDFVEQWVPRGSIVFGDDQYYFYAVEDAGSTYRTFNLVNSGLEQLKSVADRAAAGGESVPALAGRRSERAVSALVRLRESQHRQCV